MKRFAIWPLFLLLLSTAATVHGQCQQGIDPFSPAFFQQLQLSPQQAAMACRIARHVHEGLRVPVYHGDELDPCSAEVYVMPVTWTSIDCAIARDQQCLQQQLAARHPNPVAITGLGEEIARLQLTRSQVICAGLEQLACILTPEQCAMLPAM